MKNKDIIILESLKLMKNGLLKSTGKTGIVEICGDLKEIEIPEEIHTYQDWKSKGFKVKKGEKSSIKIPIWKYVKKRNQQQQEIENTESDNNEEENGAENLENRFKDKFFMVNSSFFTAEQVEPMEVA